MFKEVISKAKKEIENFLFEEEGNITRNKVLTIGGMMMVMGAVMAENILAAHRSHSSHRSHTSSRSGHSSHSSGSHGSHSSSHSSHASHTSHASHSSGSNNTSPSYSTQSPTYSAKNFSSETTTIPRTISVPKNSSIGINNNIVPAEQSVSANQVLGPDSISHSTLPSEFKIGFALPNTPKVILGDH